MIMLLSGLLPFPGQVLLFLVLLAAAAVAGGVRLVTGP